MSQSGSPQGNTSASLNEVSNNNYSKSPPETPAAPPSILLNNLKVIPSTPKALSSSSVTNTNNNLSRSSIGASGTINNNNGAEHSVRFSLGSAQLSTSTPHLATSAPPKPRSFFHRLQRDVEIDIEDDQDGVSVLDLEVPEDYTGSTENNNLIFRIGPGSGTSDTLRVPGIFSSTRRILSSTDNLLMEGEMSEEKLLKALEDDEARDQVPSPTRWRKTSETQGLNKGPRSPPLLPLRTSKSSSALLGGRPGIGAITTNNSLWMSHDCGEDYLKHECDDKCSSALHMAVKTGNLDEVEIQLETGADPNARDCYGRTPLHYAVTMGNSYMQCIICIFKTSCKSDVSIYLFRVK